MTPGAGVAWRRQQSEALAALDAAWARGLRRAWVSLPPGGGKTLVGLEAARRLRRRTVVLVPNTAIAAQWLATAPTHDPARSCGERRDLADDVTVLTYQVLAQFDPDSETAPEGWDAGRQVARLASNGAALVETLVDAAPLTLVLDEAHHLVATWGELLDEVLGRLGDTVVIGLTATPPATVAADEAALMARLLGPLEYTASIPGFVRDGHLAPFRELVWLTEPTPGEARWLAAESERFAELTTDLMAPDVATTAFLPWLDARFVSPTTTDGARVSWRALERSRPDLARAALRAHVAGLMARPVEATVREEHRTPMDADDWAALVGDYAAALSASERPRDAEALASIRAALPAVGYRLTRRGIARTSSPVDRVIARSAAKAAGAVEIVAQESVVRGDGLRALVLCDYERASATLPARLVGVIGTDEGSARAALAALVADPTTAALDPVLVSGRAVACSRPTAARLVPWLRRADPELTIADVEQLVDARDVVDLEATWSSRRWVPLLTRWLEDGEGRVLVGTRALLGEGWDARRLTTLVDLTSATTPMAVTQTRGRALRTDPLDPTKVAHHWSVACIADGHPKGDADWERLVRKHTGFLAVTDDGVIVDGVAHLDAALSPHAPPDAALRAAINAHSIGRARARERTRELWEVGTPYEDVRVHEIRVRAAHPLGPALPALAGAGASAAHGVEGSAVVLRHPWWSSLGSWWRGGDDLLAALDAPFSTTVEPIAAAVADALEACGLASTGAAGVRLAPTSEGTYRVWLDGVDEPESAVFVTALDEALAPLAAPRYVVPRYVLAPAADPREARRLAWRRLWRRPVPALLVWHAVPSVLGSHGERARTFAQMWRRWVGPGEAAFTGSPEGAAALAAQRGDDPFDVLTAQRVDWR